MPIIVVEPDVPSLPKMSGAKGQKRVFLDQIKHPYRRTEPLKKIELVKNCFDKSYCITDNFVDPGHALHVSHIIGGRAETYGWLGLASEQQIFLWDDQGFSVEVSKELNQTSKNPAPPIGLIYNMSFTWDNLRCEREEDEANKEKFQSWSLNRRHSLGFRNNLKKLSDPRWVDKINSLFVISASTRSSNCDKWTPHYPQIITREECTEISCFGYLPIALTVASLDKDLKNIREETRFIEDDRVLLAPGTEVVSADLKNDTPVLSFRSGSSQAAALVSSIAALVASKSPDLTGKKLKERLIASADLPSKENLSKSYGVVNPMRALKSPSDKHTVWYGGTNKDEQLPPFCEKKNSYISGEGTFYSNKNKFKKIPAFGDSPQNGEENPLLHISRERIIAIKRTSRVNEELKFRTMYWGGNGASQRIRFTDPYQIEMDTGRLGGPTCDTHSWKTQSKSRPCLKINEKPIDMRCVGLILFPKDERLR